MPHYEVTEQGKAEKRWVRAPSAKAAIQHCIDASKFSTRTMTSVDDAADLIAAGVKMEDATAPAQPEPQTDTGDGEPASETPPNDDPPEETRKNKANAALAVEPAE